MVSIPAFFIFRYHGSADHERRALQLDRSATFCQTNGPPLPRDKNKA